MSKTVEKVKAADAVPEERKIDVDPKRVTIADSNQAWRHILVRMSRDAISDDLRNPQIWKLVQARRDVALQKLDHLLILGYDESWMARATVTAADSNGVSLAIEKVAGFREQGESAHFNNGTFEVVWASGAYEVRRVSDGVPVGGVAFGSVPQAVHYIHTSLMPRRVA